MKRNYIWDEENGIAKCQLIDHNLIFEGIAKCDPQDVDFKSEKTGMTIAEARAYIKYYQSIKRDTRAKYQTVSHLYDSMCHSKYYNPKGYETKLIHKEVKRLTVDLEALDMIIDKIKTETKTFIDNKEDFYTMTRKHRLAETK